MPKREAAPTKWITATKLSGLKKHLCGACGEKGHPLESNKCKKKNKQFYIISLVETVIYSHPIALSYSFTQINQPEVFCLWH